MVNFAKLALNLELSQLIVMVTSFILAFLLLFIKVPTTEYSRKLVKTKNSIAVCFFVCSVLMYVCLGYREIARYEAFSALMMFVITAVSAVVLSYALTNLLEERDTDKFYLNLGAVIAMSWVLMKSFFLEPGTLRTVALIVSIGLFLIQCAWHIVVFNRIYARSVAKLEQYYDEEEDYRIRWIRFCYIIMMLTQMFVLVYMALPQGFMKIYALWYVLFMVYFSANYISFLGSHKLLLDAFAYRTLSFQDVRERREKKKLANMKIDEIPEAVTNAELKRLEKALEKWVEEKRYREYDRSREEIARELKTSKELLHLYFTTKVGADFKSWRTELRIEDAKKLLLERKELSINMVGEMSGFSDRSNFHRQFTKIVGCSPKQWRESGGNAGQA